MKDIRIEKLTLNIGTGKEQERLSKALKLLEKVSGRKPVKTITKKRIPTWGVRPGLPIGCIVTVRKKEADKLLATLLTAKDNKLAPRNFDEHGNINFGIHEYIDIEGLKYDPEIGIIGLQATVTLERPGYRIKKRKLLRKDIGKHHVITRDDAIAFMKEKFKVEVEE